MRQGPSYPRDCKYMGNKKKRNKAGRPTLFSQELADLMCHQLAQGISLRTVCKADDMPAISSVFNWFRTQPKFLEQYARAKEESADALAEEIIDISDESLKVIKKGAEKKSGAYAQAQRLRVDTRKWIMSKMKPKKYGDKIDMTTNGKDLPAPLLSALDVHHNHSDKKDSSA